MAMMYFMTYADGRNDLIGISEITGVPVKELTEIVDKLYANGLIKIL
jgi:aminopeptidase-like protein